MNKLMLAVSALLLPGGLMFAETAPAFPGAEGHGRYTTGGRGGEVRHVTNLNDSGAGSLREALKGNNPKIIVFDVSGYIDLKSELKVTSNTTIAGQTAPEGGITLRYYTISFTGCDNVIVRFIRSRRSQIKDLDDGADATWGRNHRNIIIDHCSLSWSIDEVASFYDNRDFTLQWSTIAEGLRNAGHTKGPHSYGGIWGGKNASFHHNLIAHVDNRAPRFNGARYEQENYDKDTYVSTVDAERVDFRNCVVYNWGSGGCYGGPGGGYINMVNNYYKAGPGTKNKTRVTQVTVAASGNSSGHPNIYGIASRYYINGNYVTAASTPESYDWSGVVYDSGLYTYQGERYTQDPNHYYGDDAGHVAISGVDCVKLKLDAPAGAGEITTHSAVNAFDRVLATAGASLYRDAADARYAEEALTGTATYRGIVGKNGSTGNMETNPDGILNVINDPSGAPDAKTASYPDLPSTQRNANFDTDGDGMPDYWELANGLDPNDASDGAAFTIDHKGWYTNLEVYLNSIVEDIMKAGNTNAFEALDEYYPEYNKASSAIESPSVTTQVKSVEYYDLRGIRIQEPLPGINIRRTIYADGSTVTDKVIK